jgi:hypothetical protein
VLLSQQLAQEERSKGNVDYDALRHNNNRHQDSWRAVQLSAACRSVTLI